MKIMQGSSAFKEVEFKHWCGCITYNDKDGAIHFKKMCQRHIDNRNYVWIAMQHPITHSFQVKRMFMGSKPFNIKIKYGLFSSYPFFFKKVEIRWTLIKIE